MKKNLLFLLIFISIFSACDLDKNSPSVVNPDLNLKFVNGDYIPSDADAQLMAVQNYYYMYIVFPPNTMPSLLIDSSGVAKAIFKYKELESISVGDLMYNGDTLPYYTYVGYSKHFNTNELQDVFKFGAHWDFYGNERYNFPGGSMDNSLNIPRLSLDTVLSTYKKSIGINVKIKSTDMNCNRLVLAIKKGDSTLFAKELEPFSTSISLSPDELAVLSTNSNYDLVIKVKNYKVIVNSNKKYYYLNEINSVHDFVLE
jgi:hypothetical protein